MPLLRLFLCFYFDDLDICLDIELSHDLLEPCQSLFVGRAIFVIKELNLHGGVGVNCWSLAKINFAVRQSIFEPQMAQIPQISKPDYF